MAGIASDRGPGIQVGPIAALGSEIAPTPAIGDLMEGFKQGFITVDDLVRRQRQNVSEIDQQKTQLQAGDFQRRLAPGAFQNAQAAQGLQASQIQAAGQVLPGATQLAIGAQEAAQQEADRQAALTSDDEETRIEAETDQTNRLWGKTFGTKVPGDIKVPALNPTPPDNFDQWLQKTHGKNLEKEINNFQPGVPDVKGREQIIATMVDAFMPGVNTREANVARSEYEKQTRAEMESVPLPDQLKSEFAQEASSRLREDPAVRTEYEQYRVAQGKQMDTLKAGSPEHTVVLKQRIQDAQDKAALRAAKLSAVPAILKSQADAVAAAPGKAAEAQSKAQGDVLAELHRSEALKRFEPQFEAFSKLDVIRNSGRAPTSADDIAGLYLFVKLLDPTSAVREGEVDLTKSTNPYVVQTYNRLKSAFDSKNKIVGDTARRELFATMDSLKQGALATAAPEIKRVSNIAIDRGVPLDQIFTGPYRAILSGGSSQPAATPPPANVGAKRVVQAGTTFEWDGTRYAPVP